MFKLVASLAKRFDVVGLRIAAIPVFVMGAKVVFADDTEEWYEGVASCVVEGENVADVAVELS